MEPSDGDRRLDMMQIRHEDRRQHSSMVQVLRRVWRTLPVPVRRVAWRVLHRLEGQTGLLSARAAQLAHGESVGHRFPPVDPAFVDRLAKEQAALAHRLLSIEEALALRHGDAQSCSGNLTRIDAAPGHRQPVEPGSGPRSETTTVAFDDVGLHLTTGPYGRFLVMTGDPIGGALERGEFCNPPLRPIIERCGDQGRVAIDVGAGIGFHTVFMAHHFGQVHAFEQRIRCFHMLNANLALNGCDRVLTYEVPLHDEEIAMEQTDGARQGLPLSAGGNAIDDVDAGIYEADRSRVPVMRSATIDSLGLQDVGFIKVDARGCHFRVLRGACRTIAAGRPTIAFEFDAGLARRHGDTLDDIRQFFAGCGYDLTEIAQSGRQQQGYLATPR